MGKAWVGEISVFESTQQGPIREYGRTEAITISPSLFFKKNVGIKRVLPMSKPILFQYSVILLISANVIITFKAIVSEGGGGVQIRMHLFAKIKRLQSQPRYCQYKYSFLNSVLFF